MDQGGASGKQPSLVEMSEPRRAAASASAAASKSSERNGRNPQTLLVCGYSCYILATATTSWLELLHPQVGCEKRGGKRERTERERKEGGRIGREREDDDCSGAAARHCDERKGYQEQGHVWWGFLVVFVQ